MRHAISKIIALFCAIGIVFAVNTSVFAADASPEISIKMTQSEKIADISIKNVGTMIYSAQITLKVNKSADYTVKCPKSNMYAATTSDDESVTLYIDSTELLNGSEEIKLCTLISASKMSIKSTADVILVDYSMRPQSYNDVRVRVTTNTADKKPQISAGGGGGSGNLNTGGIVIPVQGQPSPTAAPSEIKTEKSFDDVPSDFWAADSIGFVTQKGLFEGTSDNTFEPNAQMTRAMYVTVLNRFGTKVGPQWRIECEAPASFDDIPDGEWYSDAVAWAGGTGIVNGVGDNCFAPNQSITREQMAVMIVNFANACGVHLPTNLQELSFEDEDSIHDWAVDAVHIAQRAGIINGRDDNNFAPLDVATRAEVATIMHRLVLIFE